MFGLSVTGNVAPENVKPAPVRLAELTVTAELPVEVSVTGRVTGVPTGSLPKLKVVVLKERTALGEMPEPLRPIEIVLPLLALLEMVIEPLAVPVTVGLKVT